MNPWTLNFWQSGEYQLARERMDDDVKAGFTINPSRKDMFRALSLTKEEDVRCIIVGQDPYPDPRFATGVAFSIPAQYTRSEFPPTLRTVLTEYATDLSLPYPGSGNLEAWCRQGVLLWNAIPSCRTGQSLSHDWRDNTWGYLTSEVVQRATARGVVAVFVGAVARRFAGIPGQNCRVITTSHPSPRGNLNSKTPFSGSRIFSEINRNLNFLGFDPIDWRLDNVSPQVPVPRSNLDQPPLPNLTGAKLPGLRDRGGPNIYESAFTPS